MNNFSYIYFLIAIFYIVIVSARENCSSCDGIGLKSINKCVVPSLDGTHKGDSGKIGIIGGSTEYTGAPYFAAISALKVGSDLVYVITTEAAAPVIKSYSPDLIVYPYLHTKHSSKIYNLLSKIDVVVIGPGLGRENETMLLTYDIIRSCKELAKPLVIDADGLYAVYKQPSIIKDYPSPGAILTPNHIEADRLKTAAFNTDTWYSFWGANVAVLVKGKEDTFYSGPDIIWQLSEGGSGRRAGGQGDILAGSLGTFYNWALTSKPCGDSLSVKHAQSLVSYAAAKFTRICNSKAYYSYGRSMTASDMINEIHNAFKFLTSTDRL